MQRSHCQDEFVLHAGHVDPAGVDVVLLEASEDHPALVEGEEVAVSVIIRVCHCSLA